MSIALKSIFIILSLSLLMYILKGFAHDVGIRIDASTGPLSGLLGSIASLTTCGIAIRALLVAKKWRNEKTKAEIFDSATKVFGITKTLPLTMLLINKELEISERVLILKQKEKTIEEMKCEIILEIKEFSSRTSKLQHDVLKDIVELTRFNNYITSKYKILADNIQAGAAAYLGNLNNAFSLTSDGHIQKNQKLKDASEKLFLSEDEVYRDLGYEMLPEFIDIDKMVKETIK